MATNESENNSRRKPANDSIDELLDGVPADPILPKKRARPMDQAGSASSTNRRADDKVIARDEEAWRRQSSTAGTMLEAAATRQKIGVALVMMVIVLGAYAFVRHSRKDRTIDIPPATAQNVQNTAILPTPIPTPSSSPVPSAVATDVAPAPSARVGATRHPHVQPAPSARGSNFSGL